MLLSLSLRTKPRDCLRFRALASLRFFCSKRCVACWCLTSPGMGGVFGCVNGLLDLATSNFCGGAGRAEKGRLMVFRCWGARFGAGAVDGLCCEESFCGSRRWRLGATRVKGVRRWRVSGSRRWRLGTTSVYAAVAPRRRHRRAIRRPPPRSNKRTPNNKPRHAAGALPRLERRL